MNRFALYSQLLGNRGLKYLLFRVQYEIKRKSGLLKKKFPTSIPLDEYISLSEWKKENSSFFFSSRKDITIKEKESQLLEERAKQIFNGNILFFSAQVYNLGSDYDWITNPDTGYRYDISKHWTEIEDIVKEAGDIKYVWEKSRFSFLYTVIRHDQYSGKDHSEFVFSQINDWVAKNPLNMGPNYKCSQEISIRVLNWLFALNYYKRSEYLTEDVFQTIIHAIYGQVQHIFRNINFSRICVRNNHAITETLTLYLVGLLCPFFPESKIWRKEGKKWFEKEIDYQIEEDGTFIQNSMNYHRVAIQLFTWAISLADRNGEKFSDFVYEKAYKSLNFLYQCQDTITGWLPNYGANDGALFFPLNDCDYRDYRPQLDALHFLLTGKRLYSEKYEDSYWFCSNKIPSFRKAFSPIKKQHGLVSFEKGGYYIFREEATLTFIRCGLFKKIPGQADNLHIDIWHNGENILMDSGSYKYNTDENTIKFFNGTESHNTVMIDDYDQMLKGPRFIWYYWPKVLSANIYEDEAYYVFEGFVNCFRQIGNYLILKRIIKKKKGVNEWIIEDSVSAKPSASSMRQIWHTVSDDLVFTPLSHSTRVDSFKKYSDYYGVAEDCSQIEFITREPIVKTEVRIN